MEFDAGYIVELAQELEREYSLRPRHPEREQIYADYAARSARFRDAHPGWRSLQYATPERCAIDWFPPLRAADARASASGAPLLIFIHGGFWRALDRRLFSFIAEHYVEAGVATAMIGYELAPTIGLTRIVEQVHEAVSWLNRHADELGFARDRVSIAGHSAGAHLSAMIAACAPAALGGRPLVSAIPISGVFALEPLLLTTVNHDVRMTPEEAVRLSPVHATRFHVRAFLVAVGALETEGFVGQSTRFDACVRARGGRSELMIVDERTHFDILEDLARPGDALFERTLSLVTEAVEARPPIDVEPR